MRKSPCRATSWGVAGRSRHARSLGGIRRGTGEGLPLFLDEGDVVFQMTDGVQQQLPQRDQPTLGVDAGTLQRLLRDGLEDAGHLAAGEGDQGQFFFEVAVVVADGLGVGLRVSGHQQRAVQGQRPLQAVCEELLAVADVADDLQRTPLPGDRAGKKLVAGHAGDRRPQ